MKRQLLFACFMLAAGCAAFASTGALDKSCVRLNGAAWATAGAEDGARIGPDTDGDGKGDVVKTSCLAPGAVAAADVVAVGETGAKGYGSVLSSAEIRDVWISHGGDPAKANIAAAVARAESGGRPMAVNASNSNGSIDRGLFQINSCHGADSTFDLDRNVNYAVALSRNGSNWGAWTTYTSGAYTKYLEA